MRLFVLISILIHLILISFFIPPVEEDPIINGIAPKNEQIIIVDLFNNKKSGDVNEEGDLPALKPETVNNNCERFYYGIGIDVSFVVKDNVTVKEIMYVYPGYPAHKAGLQKNDLILDEDPSLRGDRIDKVKIVVQRGSEIFDVVLFRDKICIR